ncbi:hypothetical protein NPIL_312191 [Nephila pilipes]|uniref:Uncharacterized protein n=1 Tax=Nephila pilipes TaxID=299642 RepID=A0A8X6NR35_NEPPI|nr:hypothetical protein NPIL_312191 [Nephila pilipes]
MKNSTLSEDTSTDLDDITKREATPSDSQTETEVSNIFDITPPERSGYHQAFGRPRILRTSKRGRPRKEYGQVSRRTNCFETFPSIKEALARPNKVAWKNTM